MTAHRLAMGGVLIAYLALGALYAIRTPLWQAPDEPAHYNYIAHILDEGPDPPEMAPGDYPAERLESLKAERFKGEPTVAGIEYEDYQPPAYYYAAAAAALAAGSQARDRVRAIRLFGVLLGAATVWLSSRVALLAAPGDPRLAVAVSGFVAFLPMHLAVTASVNNDSLAYLLCTALVWLSLARASLRIGSRRFVASAALLLGLGLLTKVSVYPAAALVAAAEASVWWRARGTGSPVPRLAAGSGNTGLTAGSGAAPVATGDGGAELAAGSGGDELAEGRAVRFVDALRRVVIAFGVAALIGLPWFARNALVYGPQDPLGTAAHNQVVEGQPLTADWLAEQGRVALARRFVVFTFDSFWGVFGWLGVFLDQRIYLSLAVLSVAAGAGLALYAIRLSRAPGAWSDTRRACLALLALAAALAAAVYVAYNFTYVQHQGRYLFPALAPIATMFCLGIREWPRRAARKLRLAESQRIALEAVALYGLTVAMAALSLISLQLYIVPGLG